MSSEQVADEVENVVEFEQCKNSVPEEAGVDKCVETSEDVVEVIDDTNELVQLRNAVTMLNNRCQELQREKADLNEELEKTKQSLQAESEALANKTDDSKELETLQLHTKKLELEISSLINQRDSLEVNLEELDVQHEQAIEQIIQSRDALSTQNKELMTQNEHAVSQLQGVEELKKVLCEAGITAEGSEEKIEDVVKRLAESHSQSQTALVNLADNLIQVKEEYKKLQTENQKLMSTKSLPAVSNVDQTNSQLEIQLREKDNQISSLKDILKVYKENLDPDLEAAKSREMELQRKLDELQKSEELEKARIMAVLNDKARENSSLKAEVHRLVSVVSAERAAITKLQKDCEQLANSAKSPGGQNEEIKQATNHLSRLVSDRNLEIEALKEKNNTLTELLQARTLDSSSTAVLEVVKQLEEVRQKEKQYQLEHEQLITLVNQKHHESVTYHAEIIKLNAALQEEKKNCDMLRDVSKKLDEKQKTCMVAQNEAVTLQAKIAELEHQHEQLQLRYNRLLHEDNQKKDNAVPDAEASTVRVDREEWSGKLQELERCHSLLQDRDRMLYEKDCLVHEKMRQIESSKELFKRKEEELSSASQRYAHLSGQLEASHREGQAVRDQNASLRSKLDDQRSEIALLKETNSALSVTLQEREFELKALRGKVETLSRLVEQQRSATNRGEEEQNNIRKLLSDSEEMRHRAQGFQTERDQTMLALSHKQRENEYFQDQMRTMKEREDRLVREVERLRSHLMHVEDSYTQEALRSEEREKELRTRLSQAEDRIQMATSNQSAASQHASLQVESLQEQLSCVMEQRDLISDKCSRFEDQLAQKTAALRTLQVVLEQLQEEKRRDIATYQTQCESSIRLKNEECLRLSNEVDSLATQLQEANEALAAASRLTEQLDRKEEMIAMLKEHVEFQENTLDKVKAQIELMQSSSDVTVDKTIVKNLVVGYITLPHGQQKEVLRIIATVLDFNQAEREKTGLEDIKIGWISWLSGSPKSKKNQVSQQSLSEAFVRFLESESQPRPNIKFSIESLTSDRDSRTKRRSILQPTSETPKSSNKLQNPFVVSMLPPTTETTSTSHGGETSSNLLMKPMSTALPTFFPLVDRTASNDILRDVLK